MYQCFFLIIILYVYKSICMCVCIHANIDVCVYIMSNLFHSRWCLFILITYLLFQNFMLIWKNKCNHLNIILTLLLTWRPRLRLNNWEPNMDFKWEVDWRQSFHSCLHSYLAFKKFKISCIGSHFVIGSLGLHLRGLLE